MIYSTCKDVFLFPTHSSLSLNGVGIRVNAQQQQHRGMNESSRALFITLLYSIHEQVNTAETIET
jgi:hypothetical protein